MLLGLRVLFGAAFCKRVQHFSDHIADLPKFGDAKAVAVGEALQPSFRLYAKNVVENARALAETLKACGLDIVSGGTDTHLRDHSP